MRSFPHPRADPPGSSVRVQSDGYNARFNLEGYNRIEQEEHHSFYKQWSGDGFPRFLCVEIQHRCGLPPAG